MNYKPNTNQACFGVALTNLLLYLKDETTACEVWNNYESHSLVRPKGDIHPAFATRLVKDLTQEKYDAILYMNWEADPKNEIRHSFIDSLKVSNPDCLVEIIAEEEKSRSIRGFSKDMIQYMTPSILFLKRTDKELHAIAYLGNDRYIENGVIKSTEQISRIGLKEPCALVEIRKK